MANRADVYVKHNLTSNQGDINVTRKLSDGSNDVALTIAYGGEEMVHLPTPEESLLISAPQGVDTRVCDFKVKSDVDLAVACSRTDSTWAINIVPNELDPITPTTVNIDLCDDEPE